MKKGFTILSVILLSCLSGFCRTENTDTIIKVPSGVKAYLTAVAFADAFNGIIVGDSGRILKSSDRGKTWRIIKAPTKAWLSAVQFTNSRIGYIVGDSGTILKTTNGGDVWTKLNSPAPGDYLSSVSFPDPDHGYIGGYSSRAIYKTRDGGKTWTTISLGENYSTSIVFTDTAKGYVLEQFPWLGRACWPINKTTDGAHTFTAGSCANMDVSKLKLVSGNIGFAIGGNALYSLADGKIGGIVSAVPGIQDLSFSDASNGFAVGDLILKTNNGGKSWSASNATAPRLNAVYALAVKDAIAVGADGLIVRITDAGQFDVPVLSLFGAVAEETKFKIYPNPFSESFFMNFGISGKRSVKIYNCLGQELRSLSIEGDEEKISMGAFGPGIYYINVDSENGKTTHRIVKE